MAIFPQHNFDDPLDLHNASICKNDCQHPFHRKNNYFNGGYPNSCCCGCYTASDGFDRAEIGSTWEVIYGQWGIVANKLVESGGSGVIIFQRSDTEYHIASSEVHAPESGDVYSIYVGYLDTGNYHRYESTLAADNVLLMKLIERVSGVEEETVLQTCSGTWDSTDPVTFTACLGQHVFMGWPSLNYGGVVATNDHTFIAGGTRAGVGHLNGVPRSGVFDDFSYSEHYDSDTDCPDCGFCSCDDEAHTTPAVLQLTYLGYDEGCNDCSTLTGYTIDMEPQGSQGSPDSSCTPIAWRAQENESGSCFEPFDHPNHNPGDPWFFRWWIDCPLKDPNDLENWTMEIARYDSGGDQFAVALCGFIQGGFTVDSGNNPVFLPPAVGLIPNTGLSTCHPLYLVYNVDYYDCAPSPHEPVPEPPNPPSCSFDGEIRFPEETNCMLTCSGCGMQVPIDICHRVHFDIVVTEKA